MSSSPSEPDAAAVSELHSQVPGSAGVEQRGAPFDGTFCPAGKLIKAGGGGVVRLLVCSHSGDGDDLWLMERWSLNIHQVLLLSFEPMCHLQGGGCMWRVGAVCGGWGPYVEGGGRMWGAV